MSDSQAQGDYLRDPAAATVGRVPFRSRGEKPREGWKQRLGPELPRLRERPVLLLLLFVFALQLASWWQLEGYQLADSVEYMERAQAFVIGDEMRFETVKRSFGFSALLVPFFAVARFFDVQDLGVVVVWVRLFQMCLGLGLVLVTMRLAARLGGRRVGLAAGLLVGTNPIFLQWSVSPVSGVAAALFLALGLQSLLEREGGRRSFVGGLWLGTACLMAYQSLLVALPLVGLVFLRDRFKHKRSTLGAAAGLCVALGAQVALDKFSYGTWGVSLGNYLMANVGYITIDVLRRVGLEDLARRLYFSSYYAGALGASTSADPGATVFQNDSLWLYAREITRMLVLPVLALGALGLLRMWKRPSWKTSILLALVLVNVAIMTLKDTKSFRLWLPLLPLIAPLCAYGLGSILGPRDARVPLWRLLPAVALLLAAFVLGEQQLREINTRRFGTYWRAMELVNDATRSELAALPLAAAGEAAQPAPVVVAAWPWAVFGRNSAELQLLKLPTLLSPAPRRPEAPSEDSEQELARWRERRAANLETLLLGEWLIVHGPILEIDRELTSELLSRYGFVASFWEAECDEDLGPVHVLRRLGAGPEVRPAYEVLAGPRDPGQYRQEHQLAERLPLARHFTRTFAGDSLERLTLLGLEFETLPGSGFEWITYHWTSDTGFAHDYRIVDRLATDGGEHSWQNNHEPAHGVLPTSRWQPGSIVRESYVLCAAYEPFQPDFAPIGGAWRGGDLIPASFWLKLESVVDETVTLAPAHPGEREGMDLATVRELEEDVLVSERGERFSPEGLIEVARLFVPVHPIAARAAPAELLWDPREVAWEELPHRLDYWQDYETPGELERILADLQGLEWLQVHRPLLEACPPILHAVNEDYELVAARWTGELDETGEEIGVSFCMRRLGPGEDGRRLFGVETGVLDLEAYRRREGLVRDLQRSQSFVGRGPAGELERLTFLGWRYRRLPGTDYGWLTYHWTTDTGFARDYEIVDRLNASDGKHSWQNNHFPGYGGLPFTSWRPGDVVHESFLVLAGESPFRADFAPLGGPWRRGDLVPVTLWLGVVEFGPDGAAAAELLPSRPGVPEGIDFSEATVLATGVVVTADGYARSGDGLLRIGRFFVPTHPDHRWPDDGRPDPD